MTDDDNPFTFQAMVYRAFTDFNGIDLVILVGLAGWLVIAYNTLLVMAPVYALALIIGSRLLATVLGCGLYGLWRWLS